MAVIYLTGDQRELVMESSSEVAEALAKATTERWPFICLSPLTGSSEPTVLAVAHITHVTS